MLAPLAAARFLHFAAATFLFGGLLFPLYAFTDQERSGHRAVALAAAFSRPLRLAAVIALLSGLAWFVFDVAQMAGDPSAMTDGGMLVSTARDTDFGVLWILRMALAAGLLALLLARRRTSRFQRACAAVAAVFLASLSFTGHARADEGWREWLHVGADAAHLLTAGFWIGALPPIVAIVGRARRAPDERLFVHSCLGRFSSVAVVAVAILLVSGVVNTALMIASPLDLVRAAWGWVLIAKLALVAAMLAAAAINRQRLTPALAGWTDADESRVVGKLRRNTRVEIALAAGVLAAVSVLGLLAPTP